jgi:polar amino acid transport system substrate-binding protein
MREIKSWWLLALTCLLAACGETPPSEKAKTQVTPTTQVAKQSAPPPCRLVLGWDPWEPYHFQNLADEVVGLDIDLITAVSENAGCKISYYRQGWSKLLKMVKDGQVDILAGATKTASREQFSYFSEPYRKEEFWLYVSKDKLDAIKDLNLEQLMEKRFRVGVIQGYLYDEQVTKYQDDIRYQGLFLEASMSEINVSLLLDGEIDGFIEDKYVGSSILKRKNLASQIVAHPLQFTNRDVHMMVSRNSINKELFKKLDNSLKELEAKGELKAIKERYIN